MIAISRLRFDYGGGVFALEVPELRIARGEKIALIGPSGSGKTTLAYLIAGVLTAKTGRVEVGGQILSKQNDRARRDFRISRIGFVFQEFELLDYLNVRDNMLLPYYVSGALQLTNRVRELVEELAGSMGLFDKLARYPKTLSQGEKQRVAICRALTTSPEILIADEPTGNLDPKTADVILSLLLREAERRQATLLMVTHNHALLDPFDRVIDVTKLIEGATR